MFYLVVPADKPLKYVSSGHLYNKHSFLHPSRLLDSFVFIYVTQGTLHISQDGRNYNVSKNQYIILYAHHHHWGFHESKGLLTYYWVHFYLPSANYQYYNSEDNQEIIAEIIQSKKSRTLDLFIMPEYDEISTDKRVPLLFSQLLDFSRHEQLYSKYLLHYSLSSLFMELTQELLERIHSISSIPPHIHKIMDWIRHNYYFPLTVKSIAHDFNYNPNYLSSSFKIHTGESLIHYINKTRIHIARNLLSTYDMSIKETAYSCGFNDEKYFMKLFRQFEGMTPTEYKRTFYKKKTNSQ